MIVFMSNIHGASVKKFISNYKYRRQILEQIAKKIAKLEDTETVTVHSRQAKEWNEDEQYKDRIGDDFEVDEIHRYEHDLVNAFKVLCRLLPDTMNEKARFTRLKFDTVIGNFDAESGGVYGGGWFYFINFWIVINEKMFSYHRKDCHLDHGQRNGEVYNEKKHIIAYDGTYLCSVNEDRWDQWL
jgi:hypothetical protein